MGRYRGGCRWVGVGVGGSCRGGCRCRGGLVGRCRGGWVGVGVGRCVSVGRCMGGWVGWVG